MADTLRNRVTRLIAGGAYAFLDKLEEAAPIAMLEQAVREVDSIAGEVRTELGRTVANRYLVQQQHLNLNKEHDALSHSVSNAISSSREDLATPGISRQLDIEAQLPVLESSLLSLNSEEKELSGFVDALMGKKREMEGSIQGLEASRKAAEGHALSKSNTVGSASDRYQDAQSAFSRTLQRQTGLDISNQSAALDQVAKLKELSDLVRENKIRERLASLKAQ